jgi:SPP1 gp7 family putative phage head morphogenesis protein
VANVGYVNKEVAKMYGIPYSELTPEQKKILHEDSVRRAKLIKEREEAVLKNNLKAFEDEAKMEKVLASIYASCQKEILASVTETIAKVKKAGGDWSYANQSALTRSRGLFEQIGKQIKALGQKEQITFRQGLSNIYTDQFLRQVYDMGQSITVKANFNRLNPALIQKTLDYPWSGAMFSDRLWQDKERLGRNLRVGLTQSMILGEGIPQITDRINKGIDIARYNAERVARTETKRVTYCAHDDVYKDTGVEELRYRCANGGDSRTCQYCRADNGKVFKRGEEPTLPRHPNCRCVYIPVVSDTFEDNELNELTGSVRGAENYEKWREAEAKKQEEAKEAQTIPKKTDNVSVQSVEKAYQEAYNKYLTDIERVRGSGAVNRVTNDYLNSISSNIKRVDLSLMDLDSAKEVSKHLVALDKQWISTLQEVDVVDSLGFSVAGVCQPYIDVWERTKNDKDLYSRIKYAWKEIKPKEALKYWEEDTKSAPYNYNSLVDKKNAMLQTIYHEYGHSILGGKVSEYYHTNSEVYEAVKKIERKYKRETSKYKTVMQNARFGWDKYEGMDQDERNKIAKEAEDKLKEVYVSKYANDSTGEFIAECFANACLCSNPSPYSVEVYELLKKYFGK